MFADQAFGLAPDIHRLAVVGGLVDRMAEMTERSGVKDAA
jgi:hypothetical protein